MDLILKNEKMNMKKLGLLLGLFLLSIAGIFAQSITEIDGKYYSANSKPYSGHYISVYENGNVKMEMHLTKGMKNGEVRVYFENGKINEIRSYKKNLMDGTWVTYNMDEVKVAIANYKKGLKNGEWKVWDESGKLIYEMYYVNGKKAGVWKKYSPETGELVSERSY